RRGDRDVSYGGDDRSRDGREGCNYQRSSGDQNERETARLTRRVPTVSHVASPRFAKWRTTRAWWSPYARCRAASNTNCNTGPGRVWKSVISDRYGCIFVHIPKCGGSSIEAVLWPGSRTVAELWMGFVDEFHNRHQTGG